MIQENQINLEQIINPPAEAVTTGKGKGASKGAAAADQVHFDPSDLEITETSENNFLLGDALEQIIKINYEERARLKHPQTPNWLPFKLCFVGYPFSGKSSQAQFIKDKYGLDVFNMEELVHEAIEFAENNPEPFPDLEEEGDKDQQEPDHQSSDSEGGISEDEDEKFNLKEDFRQCGLQMQELLLDGEEINDELYVKVFLTKLRMTYKYKDPKT